VKVARRFARDGAMAASVDLDDVAFMQHGVTELWDRAVAAHAALVRAWFDTGIDVVVAHGPFFEADYDQVYATADRVTHVLLRVSYAVALARVTADADRGISKDPDFLRATHETFANEHLATLPPIDLDLDTETMTASDVADTIHAHVVSRV
jgi:hypothetical protein